MQRTCIDFRSGAAVLQMGQLYFAWPTAPPFLSCRPALPPPMFVVAACTLALISAAVCLAGFALPMLTSGVWWWSWRWCLTAADCTVLGAGRVQINAQSTAAAVRSPRWFTCCLLLPLAALPRVPTLLQERATDSPTTTMEEWTAATPPKAKPSRQEPQVQAQPEEQG